MHKYASIAFVLMLIACGTNKPAAIVEPVGWDKVKAKRDLYLKLQEPLKDENGWIGNCDALLFNGLNKFGGADVDLMLAEESPGQWRRHWNFEICKPYAVPESETCISRDMFRGLFPNLLKEKDIEALKRIKNYGEGNSWLMGCGKNPGVQFARTYFNPLIRNQLNRMIDSTLPKEIEPGEGTPKQVLAMPSDYEGHLEVISIFTEYLMNGKITDWELTKLEYYAENYPNNALYLAMWHKFTDGIFDSVADVLLDENLFPSTRLPTDRDRYGHYIFQRDPGPNWQPCNEGPEGTENRCLGLIHPGIDLIFVVAVVEN